MADCFNSYFMSKIENIHMNTRKETVIKPDKRLETWIKEEDFKIPEFCRKK